MLEHCTEAAVELEHTFDMLEVIVLRPPETMEPMVELVQEHWLRERVAGALPQFRSNDSISPEYS
jgi:hypothetical protein